MRQYLLDTYICIHWLRGKYNIDTKINEVGFSNCYISEITVAELKVGALLGLRSGVKSQQLGLQHFLSAINIIPITHAIDTYAKEKVRLRLSGTPAHDDFDLLIGATAVSQEMIMVTENVKDFQNIRGIVIENWIKRE